MGIEELRKTLNPRQLQMVMGTLLGDGCITKSSSTSSVYRSQHGWKQHEYNCHKHQILSEFTNRAPTKEPNLGYGDWLSRWTSKAMPEFKFLRDLCYPNGKKTVTLAWLDLLDWEGVAFWIMDDGSLHNGRNLCISTHGFTKTEVELLALWLKDRGIACAVREVHRREKTYWTVGVLTEGTYALIQKIKPFVPACMAYKIAWKSDLCPKCGVEIYGTADACPDCAETVRKEKAHAYYKEHQEHIHEKSRAWKKAHPEKMKEISRRCYRKDIVKSRERSKLMYQQCDKDARRAQRRKYRKEMKDDPEYKAKLFAERQAYYARKKQDPERKAKMLARGREQHKKNAAKEKETLRLWRLANPEKYKAQLARAEARRKAKRLSPFPSSPSPTPDSDAFLTSLSLGLDLT